MERTLETKGLKSEELLVVMSFRKLVNDRGFAPDCFNTFMWHCVSFLWNRQSTLYFRV